jgi:hypothetical protein
VGESVVPIAGVDTPSPERLINLTEHEIVLAVQDSPGPDEDDRPPRTWIARVPPQGRFARVDDDRGRLGTSGLNTDYGWVGLTRMRRAARLRDLPAPQPGIRYVVSRLTALAARRRGDLVFPFGEIRDGDGRITGVRGIAAFRPEWSLTQRWRDWSTALRTLLAQQLPGKLWLTGVMFATATALLSGALGLWPGVADNASKNGWGGAGQSWTAWLTVGFTVVGVVMLIAAARRWRRRGIVLDEHGTAYVIEEQAITWRHEEKASVLAAISAEFASVLRVPGPEAMDENWHWEAGADTAPLWDTRIDQLVHAFWAVHYNDNQVTRNGLFTWAPWPVAMAFGARATARRRGLVLHVRQRPSYGAGGPRQELRLTDVAHDFLRDKTPAPLEEVAPDHVATYLEQRELAVTITPLSRRIAEDFHLSHERPDAAHSRVTSGERGNVLLLLVRITHGRIGHVEMDLPKTPEFTVHVSPGLASEIPSGSHKIPVAEWRLDARPGAPMSPLPWDAFPTVAELICDWVVEQVHAHPGHVTLLATRIPQELAVGLGIQLGQGPRRLGQDTPATDQQSQTRHSILPWPNRIYPVYYASSGQLVVPKLQLGAESVRPERA